MRSDVERVVVEAGDIVGQHQVEVRDVDVRLVPVDQRDDWPGDTEVVLARKPG